MDKEGKPVHPTEAIYRGEINCYTALRIRELTGRDPMAQYTLNFWR
ncbi:hypothetical protein [Paenibacillus sp. CMAA1364]